MMGGMAGSGAPTCICGQTTIFMMIPMPMARRTPPSPGTAPTPPGITPLSVHHHVAGGQRQLTCRDDGHAHPDGRLFGNARRATVRNRDPDTPRRPRFAIPEWC